MLQVALEQEVEEFLGRAHYQRGSRRRRGWRNGYEPGGEDDRGVAGDGFASAKSCGETFLFLPGPGVRREL